MSKEYGIDDELFANVLAAFFCKVILDNTIAIDASKQLYEIAINEALKERNRELLSGMIYQKCSNTVKMDRWAGESAQEKLDLLKDQLTTFMKKTPSIVITNV